MPTGMKRTICGSLALIASTTVGAQVVDVFDYAEPEDGVKTFAYSSRASGQQSWDIAGHLVEAPAAPEEVAGRLYRVRLQTAQGLPDYFPGESRIYYREDDSGIYSAYHESEEVFSEFLQLPADIGPGSSWGEEGGFWQTESLDRIGVAETAAGTFDECLYVVRRRDDGEQSMESESIYCPGIGGVGSTTTNTFGEFRSVTETRLIGLD